MGRKKKILTLINEAAESEEHSIVVLPLICGAGKSTAVSEKIAEAIQKNEGLLVVTDRVYRFNEYLQPQHNEELKDFLRKKKDCVAILKAGTASTEYESHKNCPVLMMSSQRFLKWNDAEIDYFLTWNNGRRNTILFDEKPELYFQYNIDIGVLNKYELALFEAINASSIDLATKSNYIREWYRRKSGIVASLLIAEPNEPKMNYYSFVGVDIPQSDVDFSNGEVQDDIVSPLSDIDCSDGDAPEAFYPLEPDFEDYYNSIAQEEISRNFDQFVVEAYRTIGWRFKNVDLLALTRAMHLNDNFCQLFSYRGAKTGKYECYFSVIQSEIPKMQRTGSHVVILDGTACMSLDYKQDGLCIDTENCEPYIRKLPNLTLVLVECDTTKNRLTRKNKKILDCYIQDIKKDSGAKSVCCFSYKDLMNLDKIEKDEITAEKDVMDYFGNLKGRNDLQSHSVFGQVGINMCPESYYLSRYIDQHPDQRAKLVESGYPEIGIESIIKSDEYQKDKYNDIVSDIEQNVFRTPLRTPDYKGKVMYYIYYEFSKHPRLSQLLHERFGEKNYGAKVIDGKKALHINQLGKTMTRKSVKGERTNSQRLLEESDKIAPGIEFKLSEWLKGIGITQRQYHNARNHNATVKNRFDSWLINKHDGIYKKP